MEKVSSKLPVWATVVMVVLSAGAAAWNLIALIGGKVMTGTWGIIGAAAFVLTGILAIVYIAGGHQKKVAGFYMSSLVVFAIANICEVIVCAQTPDLKKMMVSGIVMAVALLVMVFVKNLGRAINYVICAILLITAVAVLIQSVITQPVAGVTAEAAAGVLYAIVVLILIFAKFKDKEARGRWVGKDETEVR